MAGSTLKLTVDRQNKALYPFNGSISALPNLFEDNTITLQVQIVDPPTPGTLNNPTIVDAGGLGFGLRASVGQQPTGSSGGPSPLALQDTFAWDTVNKWFTADLALNTVAIENYIGSAASIQAWFELNLTLAGNRSTILQVIFTLSAVVDEGTGTVPTPTDVFLTKAETLGILSSYQTVLIKSPGAVYGRILGVADDGTPTDNIVKL